MAVKIKRITLRVPPELHNRLEQLAAGQSVSLNTLAVDALATFAESQAEDKERFPLAELSALLAPAAEADDISEEELLHHAREIRHRIWQERYEKVVQSATDRAEAA